MRKMLFSVFTLSVLLFICITVVEAGDWLVAKSYYYKRTVLPGASHSFNVRLNYPSNVDPLAPATITFYAFLVLTRNNISTEVYQPPFTTYDINNGENRTFNLRFNMPSQEGVYTVAMVIVSGMISPPDGTVFVRVFGKYPLVIGTPRQALNAHPSKLAFGELRMGRFMYPIPVKVRYNMFLPNKLGDPQSWALRIYTDNANRFKGIPKTVRKLSCSGLIHSSGKYTMPLKFWTLNWGPDPHNGGWDGVMQGPPPVEDDDFWKGPEIDESRKEKEKRDFERGAWLSVPDYSNMGVGRDAWRSLVGVFTYDGQYLNPLNPTGDFTLTQQPDPFDMFFATEAGSTAVKGQYSGRVILELFSP